MKTQNAWRWIPGLALAALLVPPAAAQQDVSVVQIVRDSEAALAAGDAARADTLARQATAKDPAYAPAWLQAGRVQMKSGRFADAIAPLEKAVALAAQEAPAWQELALARWKAGRGPDAVAAQQSYLKLKPDDNAGWRELGAWLVQLNRGAEAVDALRKAVETQPADAAAWRDLSDAQWKAGRTADAVASRQSYLKLKADDDEAWRELGNWLLKLEKADESVAAFRAAVEKNPSNAPALRELALAEWKAGRGEPAAASMEAYLKLKADDVPAWRELGAWYVKLQRSDDAIRTLRRAVELKPDDAPALRELAHVEWNAGRKADAIASLAAGLKHQPDDAGGWRELGNWQLLADRAVDAQVSFGKVVELRPDDAGGWHDLGNLLLKLGAKDDALAALRKAAGLNPDHAPSQRDLGWALWGAGHRDEGVAALRRAVELKIPESDRVVIQVVARLAEEGAGAAALDFRKAAAPDSPMLPVGLDLVTRGRVAAAEPFLAEAWSRGENKPVSGLYLAYSRALNGRTADAPELLKPFVEKGLAGDADAARVDLLLECLRLCSAEPAAADLVAKTEAGLKGRTQYDGRITDLLEKAAEEQRARGADAGALALLRRVLDRDPGRRSWIQAALLAESLEGAAAAATLLDDVRSRTKSPAVASGIDGMKADRRGDAAAAVSKLKASLDADPEQSALRYVYFRNLLRLGRLNEAGAEAGWIAARVKAGETGLRSTLAEMRSDLCDWEQALAAWRPLREQYPDNPRYAVEEATALYRLNRPDEAVTALKALLARRAHAPAYELLAEIQGALGRPADGAATAAEGLAKTPTQSLRRYHAEFAEIAGTNLEAALESARAFVAEDRGHAPMSLLTARLLEATGRTNEAATLRRSLLERSPAFLPALLAQRDLAVREERFEEAVELSTDRYNLQPREPDATSQLANALAQHERPVRALSLLRPLARREAVEASPVLVYNGVSAGPFPGRNTVAQFEEHVARLAKEGFAFASAVADLEAPTNAPRVLLVVTDVEAPVLQALDAALARHGARAVFAAPADELARSIPGRPSPAALRELKKTGRWTIASAGPGRVRREVVGPDGLLGNPLTHATRRGDAAESDADMQARLDRAMAEAAAPLGDAAETLLVYPQGDCGFLSLDTEPIHITRLREAASGRFMRAIRFDPIGFYVPGSDPLQIPARAVPAAWGADAVAAYARGANPLARAKLELAKALYWSRQHEEANRWFARAEKEGANPKDVHLNWGANADVQGDVPTALEHLRLAKDLDPDNPRVDRALTRAENRKRWQPELNLLYWEDNEDREFLRWGGEAQGHVSDSLKPGVFADYNEWKHDQLGTEEGYRAGLLLRWYLAGGVWLDGSVWHLDMDDLDDHDGGGVSLHAPNPLWSGYLEPFWSRIEPETIEALRADIYADHYGVRTYSRLLDTIDVFADYNRIDRDDDNTTDMLDARFVGRLREYKHISLGYRLRLADSDFDPPEYWAPEELQQHQAYAAVRRTRGRFTTSLSGEAGYARERGTDWNFVWGGRAGLEYGWSGRWGARVTAGHFEGAVYERNTYTAGVYGRF